MKPLMAALTSVEATDEQLVAVARSGNEVAFEALFRRYRQRIAAYVRASIPDDGRVDDVVQEVFISALRSMRSLESPDAFSPWIHAIARNACMDHLRRMSREALSIDSERLDALDRRPAAAHEPGTHTAVSRKEDFDHLRQAFHGLPPAQHEALVMRELEGRSYEEIGHRMRLSRPAVESVIFRARRGLKGEYSEISTGERCRRVRSAMAVSAEGLGMAAERRLVMRHLRSCSVCRREAVVMGLGSLVLEAGRGGPVRRAVSKAAALIPLPLLSWRQGGSGNTADAGNGLSSSAVSPSTLPGAAHGALAQIGAAGPVSLEQAGSIAQKAVAVIATVAVVGGGGVAAHKSGVDIPGIGHRPAQATQIAALPNGLPADSREASKVLFGSPPAPGAEANAVAPGARSMLPGMEVGVPTPPVTGPAADTGLPAALGVPVATDPATGTTPATDPAASDPAATDLAAATAPATDPAAAGPGQPAGPAGPGNGNAYGKLKKAQAQADQPASTPAPDPVAQPDPAATEPSAPADATEPAGTTEDEATHGNSHAPGLARNGGVPRGQAKKQSR